MKKEETKNLIKVSAAGEKIPATDYLTLSWRFPEFMSCYVGYGQKEKATEITFTLLSQKLSFLSVTEISIATFWAKN